jgi:ferric-dicitrate binding protein FerR (iron transport regulator)
VVKIDGAAAISGQTLFSGDTVQTATGSTSTLSLINSARFKLGSETSLRLEFSRSSLSGAIEKGHIDCLSPAGVGVEIKTVDASIVTDASQPAAFTIEVESCATTISVWNGRIDLRTANGARSLTAGERFSTGDAPPIPGPQQNLNKKTKIGLVVGIGAAVTVLLVAMTGKEKQEDEQFGGCVVIPSGESQPCR